MSGIIFKINKPLTLKSGTGVSLDRDGVGFTEKNFDGEDNGDVTISIGQAVETTSDVQFQDITLTSGDSLNVGGITFSDGKISGSNIRFLQDLTITENMFHTGSVLINGAITSGSGLFGSRTQTITHNTGSTIFGNILSQKQFFTGSLDITGSIFLNNYKINEISNDTDLTDESINALVTENVAKTFLATIKPDRDYLRKSFVHTGSFVNSTTSSFNAITASAPTSLGSTTENDFMFFINGMLVENDALTIEQKSSTNLELRLDTDSLGYTISALDEIIGFGKFNS
jgi:hypothetical protein